MLQHRAATQLRYYVRHKYMEEQERAMKDRKVKYPVFSRKVLTNNCTIAHLTIDFNGKSEHFGLVGLNLDRLN